MEWLVRLEGDEWSLEDLPKWFSQLDHKVRLEDGKYYLVSSAFDHCATSAEVWERAEQIVERINGAAKACDPHFRPVQIAGEVAQVHDDGRRQMGRSKASAVSATASSGTPPQPSRPERLVAMWDTACPTGPVRRALDAWLLPTTWQQLRHICDAIREDVAPGKDGKQAWEKMARVMAPMVGMAEATLNDELWRFNKTLVKPEHVGAHALHGYTRGPITNPMSMDEAKGFIRRLFDAWLSTKI
jgi:hypothetical protein